MNNIIDNVVEYTLDNGLRVLIKDHKSSSVLTCQLWFGIGSIDEPIGLSGTAHLIEHMCIRSTKNYKESEIHRQIRDFGGVDNALTSYDYTYYWTILDPSHLEFSVKTMAEKFFPIFDSDELRRETGVVLSELEGYENRPLTKLYDNLTATAFDRSPYRRSVIGYRQDLETYDRDELINFFNKYYIPNNAVLVLVGNIDIDKAKEYVNKYFSPIKKGKEIKRNYIKEPFQSGIKKATVSINNSVNMCLMAYHIPNLYHKDTYALSLLGSILSNGKTSLLYKNLVETGKASNVFAYPIKVKNDSIFILGLIGNKGIENLDTLLMEEIENIKNNSISLKELEKSINQTKANIIYENESVTEIGNSLGLNELYGNWREINNQIEKLEKIKIDDINNVINKYFVNDNLTIVTTKLEEKDSCVKIPLGLYEEYKTKGENINNILQNKLYVKDPVKYTLSNGITLIVKENPLSSTVAVEGYVECGEMYEPIGQPQVSKITASMLTSGTKERDYLQIAESLDKIGASINFDVSFERFNFHGKALSENLNDLLFNLSDCLINPIFSESAFINRKNEALSFWLRNKNIPETVAAHTFYNQVTPIGDPYNIDTYDNTLKYMNNVQLDHIIDFYNYLDPKNTTIVVVGDVKKEIVYELCEKYFLDFKSKKEKPIINETNYSIPSEKRIIDIPLENASKCEVVYGYGFNMKRNNPDFYKFKIINQVLGGSACLNARFYHELRERLGIIYGVYSSFMGDKYNGVWKTVFGTNRKTLEEAINCVDNILFDVYNKGICEEELLSAKHFILGMFAKTLEKNEGMAKILANCHYNNIELNYDKKIEDYYLPISLDEVNDAIKKYIYPNKGLMVIAG